MILGSQSVKNAVITTGATAGFDAGKLVKGRKRLVLTDTLVSRLLPVHAAGGPVAIAFWNEGLPPTTCWIRCRWVASTFV